MEVLGLRVDPVYAVVEMLVAHPALKVLIEEILGAQLDRALVFLVRRNECLRSKAVFKVSLGMGDA